MADNLTRSQKFGIQWRWLLLVGGIIYSINLIDALLNPDQPFSFLGLELSLLVYALLHALIAGWLLVTFVKNYKLFRQETLKKVINQQEQNDKNQN